MKRVLVGVALVASLIVSASPVVAAETYHWRNSGDGLGAGWSNIPWDQEVIPPGTYFDTWVDASTSVEGGIGTYDTTGNGICVGMGVFTIDAKGNWTDEQWMEACGDPTSFYVDRRLNTAHVEAMLPVIDCAVWDKKTGECKGEPEELGTFVVDLTLTGQGSIYREHGTSTGGTAGFYQYTYHGTGAHRAATASGTVTFDGASVIDGATNSWADIWSFRSGGVDIMICKPSTGC